MPVVRSSLLRAGAAAALAGLALPACSPPPPPVAAPAPASPAPAPTPRPLSMVPMAPAAVQDLLERRVARAPRYVPGEVIVKLRPAAPGRPGALSADTLRSMNLEVVREQTSGGEMIYRLPPDTLKTLDARAVGDRTLAAVQAMRKRPEVLYAQPNLWFQLAATPNDPGFARQWHYLDNGSGAGRAPGGIGLPSTWDTNTGAGVVVAVIDTGILPAHEDIAGSPNRLPGTDMVSDPQVANDGDGRDPDPTDPGDAVAAGECGPGTPAQPSSWHGTHVAGTVGVVKTNNGVGVAGVNWNVRVQPVRVLGKCGGTLADINDAIRWAAGLPVPGTATNPTPARIVNLSLGGSGRCTDAPALQAAIDDAVAAGTTVVVAAGNEASDAAGAVPASCNGVITVAASDFRGHLVTRYSNFGARVTLLAPGGDVARDDNGDGQADGVLSPVQGGYALYNGTSMAAPHVAGAAALLLSAEPGLSPAQVRTRLVQAALPRTSTQCPRPCGAGLLQASFGGAPSPGPTPQVTLAPPALSLTVGSRGTLSAQVTVAGSPQFGRTVEFASANPAVAGVAPASAQTGTDGTAQVEVSALAAGSAQVSARADGAQAGSTVTVAQPPSTPTLPLPWLALGAATAALVAGWRWRSARRAGR